MAGQGLTMRDGSAPARARLSPELVALCERPEPRQGPEPGLAYFTDGDYQAAADRFLAEAGDGPFWVFAYGSLLWRPAFEARAKHLAQAEGWRRDFCMEIRRWRGSPEQPGLMMGLRKGGTCSGAVLQLAHDDRRGQLVRLLQREVDTGEDLQSVRWIEADTSLGRVRALACWAEPVMSRMFVEKPIAEQARMLARACGFGGSGAAYLHRTVASLAGLGLEDAYLTAIDKLVAEEVIRRTGFKVSSIPGR
ncbi:MAG: gamma-glutamylcyclotransferase [Parvibaculaceae bacterium]